MRAAGAPYSRGAELCGSELQEGDHLLHGSWRSTNSQSKTRLRPLLPAVEMQRSQSMAYARPELPTTKVPSSGVAGFPLQWWRRRGEIWVRRLLPRQLNQCLVTTRGQQCVVVPSNLLQPWCMGRSTRACSDSAAASSDLFLSRFSASRAQQGGIGAEEALEEEGAKATSRRGAGALRRGVAAHFPSIPTPRARLWGVTWWACLSLVETLHRAKSRGGGGATPFSSGVWRRPLQHTLLYPLPPWTFYCHRCGWSEKRGFVLY